MKRRMVLKRRMAARIKHSVMVNPFRGKPIQPFKWRED